MSEQTSWQQRYRQQLEEAKKIREEALRPLSTVAKRASEGAKLSQRDLSRAIQSLYEYSQHVEASIFSLTDELVSVIDSSSRYEINAFTVGIYQKSLIKLLVSKELITEEELEKVKIEKTIPEIREQAKREQIQSQAGDEDAKDSD